MMGVSMIFVLLICHLGLKNIVNRPRPFEAFPLADAKTFDHAHASGSSFPSTHSATAFAAAAIMFMKYKKVLWTMFLVAAFVGFTRMYMYVHYPSDVIAGAICGIIIALMVYYVFKFSGLMDRIDGVRPKNNKRGKKYGRA